MDYIVIPCFAHGFNAADFQNVIMTDTQPRLRWHLEACNMASLTEKEEAPSSVPNILHNNSIVIYIMQIEY